MVKKKIPAMLLSDTREIRLLMSFVVPGVSSAVLFVLVLVSGWLVLFVGQLLGSTKNSVWKCPLVGEHKERITDIRVNCLFVFNMFVF